MLTMTLTTLILLHGAGPAVPDALPPVARPVPLGQVTVLAGPFR